jgi:histidine ammonia-lyase
MTAQILIAHDKPLSLSDVVAVAYGQARVTLDPGTATLIDARRAEVVAFIKNTGEQAYGFNRGFGHNVRLAVGPEGTEKLQLNLIRSHACGVGPDTPEDVVRATMLLRAISLARGYSGVRSLLVKTLIDCLNAGITPVVPRLGSVSASGDLAPLAHVALALIGEGDVTIAGARIKAADALARAGIKPLTLEMKEGLALTNGVQYSAAIAILAANRLRILVDSAAIATAVTTQVMLGADTPFRPDLHALRPHRGSLRLAHLIYSLMANSPLREAHRPYEVDREIQDPYNIRCAAQILGGADELLVRAEATLATEINSVTDNPIILTATQEEGWDTRFSGKFLGQHVDVVSGGHFHGMSVAIDAFGLIQAAGIIASLVNVRSARYVDGARNRGLGSDLKWPGPSSDPAIAAQQAISSAMMMAEYASAGLANWIWGQAMPSHLFSLSTDAGQEDHVSMASNVAWRAYETMPRLAEALAIEFAFAVQASAIRQTAGVLPRLGEAPLPLSLEQRRLSPACEAVLAAIAPIFPPVVEDRPLAPELNAVAAFIFNGGAVEAAQPFINFTP